MLVAISSDAETLFKRAILDVLALPSGYSHTFRYQTKYVAETIVQALRRGAGDQYIADHGRRVLIFYAQRPVEQSATSDYTYCPIRYGDVEALRLLGDLVFIDIVLYEFVNLAADEDTDDPLKGLTQMLRDREGALNAHTFEGAFLDNVDPTPGRLPREEPVEGQYWESVVTKLSALPSMRNCLFYRVRGLFFPSRNWEGSPSAWTMLPIAVRHGTPAFIVPTSSAVQLRLLFYRPQAAEPKTIKSLVQVKADTGGFSDVPTGELRLESRYDELRVILTTRRLFDSVLAPVSVSIAADGQNVLVSHPLLMCAIGVPRRTLYSVWLLLIAGPLLLALGAADWDCVGAFLPSVGSLGFPGDACMPHESFATAAKLAGGALIAAAGWLVFRKLPMK